MLVEQHLQTHHDLVTQLYKDRDRATHQEEHLDHESVHIHLPHQGGLNARASRDETSGHQDASSTPANIELPTSDQTAQAITADPHDPTLSEVAISQNGIHIHQDGFQQVNHGKETTRLHTSDFIQTLSE